MSSPSTAPSLFSFLSVIQDPRTGSSLTVPCAHLLFLVAAVISTWRIVPTRRSILELSSKEEWKRRLALASPRRPTARSRAATVLELLRVFRELQGRFEEVEVSLLIVHGEEDVVCDQFWGPEKLENFEPLLPSRSFQNGRASEIGEISDRESFWNWSPFGMGELPEWSF
ncbi:hypothetical protein G4B88_009278 [Cannabis sativa]|uniref:Serine aminopeptidase S33 domain-containing protein n=1 Tax=Cannabis sativa TaxID=3483 RepID=A0A7J6FNJ7_CANSA|nr:hypothetical protein G4B88_009278 [Cannabis sativa]